MKYHFAMNKYEYAKRLIDFGVLKITAEGKILRKYNFRYYRINHQKMKNIEQEDRWGYKWIILRIKGKLTIISSHRLIWFIKYGEIEKNLEINHINGIRTDNRLENIELVTHSENMIHARDVLKSINQKGEKNNYSKLKETDVIEIKNMIKNKIKLRIIAEKYKVSRGNITSIKCNRTWKHIK